MNMTTAQANLEDIKSETVREAYRKGAVSNGYQHGLAGLPAIHRAGTVIGDCWLKGWTSGKHAHDGFPAKPLQDNNRYK